ncbi:nif11-like leader peptide and RmlC-like bi-domain protein [Synechococcus sp. BIOS-E4-1]|nr:nif11-like leader peptide and RmlC-like bi-domain protein [Synechococcus sp. BIOS-E4-1]
MAEEDLQRFLLKVQQLNALVSSLDADPERRRQLAACSDHHAVVQLAQQWGYSIGRRWGEPSVEPADLFNLLAEAPSASGQETEEELCSGKDWRLMRISSNGSCSPDGFWYQQKEQEWLTLLKGSAIVRLQDPEQWVELSVGDQLMLPAGRRHRVERTDADPGTVWLALYWNESPGDHPAQPIV